MKVYSVTQLDHGYPDDVWRYTAMYSSHKRALECIGYDLEDINERYGEDYDTGNVVLDEDRSDYLIKPTKNGYGCENIEWHVGEHELDMEPGDILSALRNDIRTKMFDLCETIIPGYGSARMAACDLREQDIKISNIEMIGDKIVDWYNVVSVCLSYVVIRYRLKGDDNLYLAWLDFDDVLVDDLVSIYNKVKELKDDECDHGRRGKYFRAINPMWFVSGDASKTLMDVLDEPIEKYLEKKKQK